MQSCIGSPFSSLFKVLFGKKEVRVLMAGLDAVGQTTILYKLKTGETLQTHPTIGFNAETVEHNRLSLTILALIFVVDSSDRERIEEAGGDLARLLDDREEAIILVFANKQDIENAMNCTEITDKLGLPRLSKVNWHIQASCAVTGDGLREGLDWLALQLDSKSV